MAGDTIKIRAKAEGGVAEVKALISHPMEAGGRKDKATGQPIEAHYITELAAELNGKSVMTALWGGGVSKNPYLAFKVKAKAGDTVKLAWKDNKGESDAAEAKIS
jgi:sulfur-oxidizing protein SoxZ